MQHRGSSKERQNRSNSNQALLTGEQQNEFGTATSAGMVSSPPTRSRAGNIAMHPKQLSQQHPMQQHHMRKESYDSIASPNPGFLLQGNPTVSDTSQTNLNNADNMSIVSTLEQDRKKIQLL